ncbi:hypothetical protein [Micromonospora sp. 067-2]|uniref:hypothetical protein n=1 Tax=Micromonospora sp. 067-2 TaxID=2789270 RepID=UPI0039786E76
MKRRPNRRRQLWQAAAMVLTAAAAAAAVARAKRRTVGDHADIESPLVQDGAIGAATRYASPPSDGSTAATRPVAASR